MTDQIYYKVQYPIKKAIESIKKVDVEDLVAEEFSREDVEKIKNFVEYWEDTGRDEITSFIKKLKEENSE